jgi:glycolate oxidase iron-sulfur subunit
MAPPVSAADLDTLLTRCLHCGLCLPVCPTYGLTMREESSPRGRIRLMRGLERGEIAISAEFINEMNFCLDCQACEAICPAGVQYGALVEDARVRIAASGREHLWLRLLRRIILRGFLASRPGRLMGISLLRLYQTSGLREAVERSGLLQLFPENVARLHGLMPRIGMLSFLHRQHHALAPAGEIRGRVALLTGCLMDSAFADIHLDTVEVLLRNGFEVVFPPDQGCCGSLHAHYGDLEMARKLARKNIEVFSGEHIDAIVVNSAGCAAFMKEYQHLFADDPSAAPDAQKISLQTKEVTEFLSERGFRAPKGMIHERVTYHEACHLVHTQHISRQPREILQSIPGLDVVELREATWCCGSAGIYNITRPRDAIRLLDRKMACVLESGATIVATANPGCHLQLAMGVETAGVDVRVVHPVTLLNSAYKAELAATKG